jgi:enamine deaminase RidA (YjgF/YER057c/UK114 family)
MMRERVTSASSYEAAYGFSRAVRVGDRIEVAGTAPIPQDGSEGPEGPYDQMMLCGRIAIDAIEQLGGRVEDVVRTRVYITSSIDSGEIGRAHGELFGAAMPAATMVVVKALLDRRWKVEIEVEAVV